MDDYDPMTDPVYADVPGHIRRLLAFKEPEVTDEDRAFSMSALDELDLDEEPSDDLRALAHAAVEEAKRTAMIPIEIWARDLAQEIVEWGCAYDKQFSAKDSDNG